MSSWCRKILLTAGFLTMWAGTTAAQSPGRGQFLDELELMADKGGRNFTLLNRFRYVDSDKVTWVVPKGFSSDGASIPRVLWSIVGAPWDGEYRRAAVVHDYFFRQRKYESDVVHRVFYEAMLTDGVEPLKAKLMYYAVVRFNKRWHQVDVDPFDCNRIQAKPGSRIRCLPAPVGTVLLQEIEETPRVEDDIVRRELDQVRASLDSKDLSLAELKRVADDNYAKGEKTETPVGYTRSVQ